MAETTATCPHCGVRTPSGANLAKKKDARTGVLVVICVAVAIGGLFGYLHIKNKQRVEAFEKKSKEHREKLIEEIERKYPD